MTDAQRLTALEKRLEKKQKSISDKVASGDLSETAKREPLDPMAIRQDTSGQYTAEDKARAQRIQKAQAEVGQIEKRYARMKDEAERKSEPITKWGLRKASNFVRASMLSSLTVVEKLGAASLGRTITEPIKTGIGYGASKIPGLAGISQRAPIEGSKGFINDFRNEANATAKAFTTGIADIGRTWMGNGTDITNAFGSKESYLVKGRYLPFEVAQLTGLMHEGLKAPAFRGAFERHLGNLIMNEKLAGRPVDNETMFALSQRAYVEAQRIKFQEDNWVSTKITDAMKSLDNGKLPAQTLGAILHIIMPIHKIPTNIIKQSFEASPVGLAKGLGKAAVANVRGLDKLSPEQADIIVRNIKNGSLGTALDALGLFAGGKAIGSFYQKYDKDTDKEIAKYGTVQIGGVRVPSSLLHLPEFNSMFMGATTKRLYEEAIAAKDKEGKKKNDTATAVKLGVGGGVRGLLEEVPVADAAESMVNIVHAIFGGDTDQMSEARYGLGNFVAGRTVPGAVRNLAEWQDQDPRGHYTTPFTTEPFNRKVDTKTFGGSIKTQVQKNIPWWRNRLPNNTPTAK